MKLCITQVDGSDSGLLVYPPQLALRAMAVADQRGWDQDRRIASLYIPDGEVWYTEDPSLNLIYDLMIETHMQGLEAILA